MLTLYCPPRNTITTTKHLHLIEHKITRAGKYIFSIKAINIFVALSLSFYASCTLSEVLKVGPGEKFIFPSIAAKFARDGDVIEIDAKGVYFGDESIWKADNLVIRGINGRPVLKALGNIKNGKGIWLVKGDNTTIENIEFSNAKVSDNNGAGIRLEGTGLTVRKCKFLKNQNGILANANPHSDVLIEFSEFAYNGHGKGQTHNLYIGNIRNLTFRFNYTHHAVVGHNLKSRAQHSFILYNRIMDEETGTSSYAVDLPNGGFALLIGNSIQQGSKTNNASIIAYGAEGITQPSKELYLVNNTIVNDRHTGTFIKAAPGASVFAYNNILADGGKVSNMQITNRNNLITKNVSIFRNANNYDYELVSSADAIDAGISVDKIDGHTLLPAYEYKHPTDKRVRNIRNIIDIGAFEYKY